MPTKTIALMEQVDITNGAHILYFYNDPEAYIKNAVSFLKIGLMHGDYVVLIDSSENYALIKAKLDEVLSLSEWERFQYIDHQRFYSDYGSLHVRNVIQNFNDLFNPLLLKGHSIRSWGHVHWTDQEDIAEQLSLYEHQCELTIPEIQLLGVCIYDGKLVPAHIQNEMLRTHEYFMTDTTFTKSMLYEKSEETVILPSPAVHMEMKSEMDLYKQKLDFAHVVSHEVRNPLTVIRAYANLILKGNSNLREGDVSKLSKIIDYVDVIDHEMAHIINTEQMLTTDSLWERDLVKIKPLLHEVMAMMETKARTQAVHCFSQIEMKDDEVLYANAMGFKLIVSNLVSNAIKYSDEGGAVTVRAYIDNGLRLHVKDHGVGMTPEQLSKLFRKYEKMNVEKSGQGIGLFMVKKLIDHFEGKIDIRSKENEGTEVDVVLPLAEPSFLAGTVSTNG